jgi:hypothetical protein
VPSFLGPSQLPMYFDGQKWYCWHCRLQEWELFETSLEESRNRDQVLYDNIFAFQQKHVNKKEVSIDDTCILLLKLTLTLQKKESHSG